jgi:hypothetical protein
MGLTSFICPDQNGRTKYSYACVSTDDQNPALQLASLKKAGCQTVFKDEGLSGATTKRPALLRCLKKLEHGDTLIVWKLDRLGRSLISERTRAGVKVKLTAEQIAHARKVDRQRRGPPVRGRSSGRGPFDALPGAELQTGLSAETLPVLSDCIMCMVRR